MGLIIGLWFGINIGKGKPLYSNPLSKRRIETVIMKTGEKVIEKSEEAIEKSGKALEETGKTLQDKVKKE